MESMRSKKLEYMEIECRAKFTKKVSEFTN